MPTWIKRIFTRFHRWQYHNPYDRTCTCCGRHQVKFGYDMGDTGWWEDFTDGSLASCNRRKG